MQTPAEIRAAYPLAHPLHRLACMAAQLTEHEAVAEVWISDGLIEGQVWLGVSLPPDAPVGTDGDLRRFTDYAAPLLRRRLAREDEVEHPCSTHAQWAIIWETAPATANAVLSSPA
jgi:hypothetical protein